jgi:hypothetical protein
MKRCDKAADIRYDVLLRQARVGETKQPFFPIKPERVQKRAEGTIKL